MFRWRWMAAALVVALPILEVGSQVGGAPPDGAIVRLPEAMRALKNISAAARAGDHLFVASDETTEVLVLERVVEGVLEKSAGSWSFRYGAPPIQLPISGTKEIDIEAIAADGYTIYVAGSHSLAREKLSASRTYKKNRKRFEVIKRERNRDHIFRFEFDPDTGVVSEMAEISLRSLLERDPILHRFTEIPGSENGIDIEGLSVIGDTLYVGFRSPVLRHGFVPIVKMRFAAPEVGELLFVDLAGRGIRDMTPVGGGFLLLAGPPADGEGSFALFYWTGEDGLPGRDRPVHETISLATIDTPKGSRAEALTILRSDGSCHDLLILFDGIAGGAPRVERVCLPGSV